MISPRDVEVADLLMADILIVDDDPDAIQILARILTDVGHVRFAMSGEEALRLTQAAVPDLILLDAQMPGMSGFEVCAALRQNPRLADVPIVFVTADKEERMELAGFDAGASDFISKPLMPRLVLARVAAQLRTKRMADELRRHAGIDVLTGLASRRSLDDALEQEWSRARRGRTPVTLVVVDVDHFKLYNEHYGHPMGDVCLRLLADALQRAVLRPADLVARRLGEEFVLLLPDTPAHGAAHVTQRLLRVIEALALPHAKSPTSDHVTVSVGTACYGGAGCEWPQVASQVIEAADRALLTAKAEGRGRGCLAELADDELHHNLVCRVLRHITLDAAV